jgi:outer membrane receptor protein involved in Fe transport
MSAALISANASRDREGRAFLQSPRLAAAAGVTLAATLAVPVFMIPVTGWAQIEEIVVTARKREEALTDVPLSVEAFSGDDLQEKGLDDIAALASQSAAVKFDIGASRSDTRLSIRGLSPTRGRQNAAILVDGLDVSSESVTSSGGSILLNQKLLSLQRVEFLKGPQVALWGRSAFNGAVNFVTKDPPDELAGEFGIDGNEEDQFSARGEIGAPVFGDKLGVMLTGSWWDDDGFYQNAATGGDLGGEEGYGFALKTKSDFGNGFTVKTRAEYNHYEYRPSAEAFIGFNSLLTQPAAALAENPDVPSPRNPDNPAAGTIYPGGGTPALFCLPDLLPPDDPNNPNEVVDRLLNRTLIDQYASLSTDPSNPIIGDGPHCQKLVTTYRGKVPDGDAIKARLATDPFRQQDYEGIDGDTLRFSVQVQWELERGLFTSWTGYTDDDNSETQDSGKYANIDPTSPFGNANVNLFHNDNTKTTEQLQQELRYATRFDGPINVTLGGNFWSENVENGLMSLTMQSSGSYCFYSGLVPENANQNDGLLLGAAGCPGYTSLPIAPFVAGGGTFGDGTPYEGAVPYLRSVPIERDTKHRSIYGMLEFQTSDTTKLTLEGRWSYEDLTVTGPFVLNPFTSSGPGSWSICGAPGKPCDLNYLFHAPGTITSRGGPFWSQSNFQASPEFGGYDGWVPNRPAASSGPGAELTQLEAIDPVCLSDPAVQARIAAVTDGDPNTQEPFDFFQPYCVGNFKRQDQWFSPKITMDWKVNDSSLLYAYWSRAEKPGGFALFTIGSAFMRRDQAEYAPEIMDVYEIGGNTTIFDQTLFLSGAIYFNDYTDKQVLVNALAFDGRPVSRIDNAGAELWGGELSFQWRPMTEFLGGSWGVNGSYLYTHGEYTDFTEVTSSESKIAINGACEQAELSRTVNTVSGPVTVTRAACRINWNGNKFERAPEHSLVGGVTYTRPISDELEFFSGLDAQWKDEQYIEFENESQLDAYWNLDFRTGVRAPQWEVIAYVTNLLDDDTIRSASSQPGLSCCFVLGVATDPSNINGTVGSTAEVPSPKAAFLPPPRIIGLRATYKFGAY